MYKINIPNSNIDEKVNKNRRQKYRHYSNQEDKFDNEKRTKNNNYDKKPPHYNYNKPLEQVVETPINNQRFATSQNRYSTSQRKYDRSKREILIIKENYINKFNVEIRKISEDFYDQKVYLELRELEGLFYDNISDLETKEEIEQLFNIFKDDYLSYYYNENISQVDDLQFKKENAIKQIKRQYYYKIDSMSFIKKLIRKKTYEKKVLNAFKKINQAKSFKKINKIVERTEKKLHNKK